MPLGAKFYELVGRALPPAPWKQPAVAVPSSVVGAVEAYFAREQAKLGAVPRELMCFESTEKEIRREKVVMQPGTEEQSSTPATNTQVEDKPRRSVRLREKLLGRFGKFGGFGRVAVKNESKAKAKKSKQSSATAKNKENRKTRKLSKKSKTQKA